MIALGPKRVILPGVESGLQGSRDIGGGVQVVGRVAGARG